MTKNFNLEEFIYSKFYKAAKVQEKVIESYEKDKGVQENLKLLAEQLQVLRDELNKPITINIAYRPYWWEKMRGRTGTSQHCLGKAADITVEEMSITELHKEILKLIEQGKMINGGLGLYQTFIHYDIRSYPVKWVK